MPRFDCKGRCFVLPGGLRLLVMQVNSRIWLAISRRGDCHEAAWRAQRMALRLARLLGLRNVLVSNTSMVVTRQCQRVFRARKPRVRAFRDECLRLARPMRVRFA